MSRPIPRLTSPAVPAGYLVEIVTPDFWSVTLA